MANLKKKKPEMLTEDERVDQLFDKIKSGIQVSFRRFLKDAVAWNKKLVIERNGKVVLVPAVEIQKEILKNKRSYSNKKKID